MEKALNYSDVYLIPRYSELETRSKADISVYFLGRNFAAPWMPANMKSVINTKIAHWLSENNYFYIYQRFDDTLKFVQNANKESWKTISISIGVKQQDKDLITEIYNTGHIVDFITIDVAHGHHLLVKEIIEYINLVYKENSFLPKPKIIAGNVCTPEAVQDLANWGADAVKIGIAGGGACSTKNQTGFHVPMFSCIQNCISSPIQIIADGGIKEPGDIAKAISAGADIVMVGSMFAACIDSPAENIYALEGREYKPGFADPVLIKDPITHKRYFGSASAKNKGENRHVEGFEVDLPCNGITYEEKYQELKEAMQSAVSYSGGNKISDLLNVKWIIVK